MKDVRGKVAFVTGGASGIGLGIAGAFLEAGMKVVIADLRQDHIDEALTDLARRGYRNEVHAIRLDVTDRQAMAAAADEAERALGHVQVLVNNAGVGIEGPLKDAAYADWDYALAVNLGGVINGIQTFLPRIRAHAQGGHIVNSASLAALLTMPSSMAMYVTAKAGVIALSESIRSELAQENIGVSVLCPGPVKSRIHELAKNRPERFAVSDGFARAAERLGQRRVGAGWMEPAEVGEMVLRAVRNDELYIITHGEWRPMFIARQEALLAAMPTKVTEGLIESMRQPPRTDGEEPGASS